MMRQTTWWSAVVMFSVAVSLVWMSVSLAEKGQPVATTLAEAPAVVDPEKNPPAAVPATTEPATPAPRVEVPMTAPAGTVPMTAARETPVPATPAPVIPTPVTPASTRPMPISGASTSDESFSPWATINAVAKGLFRTRSTDSAPSTSVPPGCTLPTCAAPTTEAIRARAPKAGNGKNPWATYSTPPSAAITTLPGTYADSPSVAGDDEPPMSKELLDIRRKLGIRPMAGTMFETLRTPTAGAHSFAIHPLLTPPSLESFLDELHKCKTLEELKACQDRCWALDLPDSMAPVRMYRGIAGGPTIEPFELHPLPTARPAAIATAPIAAAEPCDDDQLLMSLRHSARLLDAKANDLEDQGRYDEADRLRNTSERLRSEARRVSLPMPLPPSAGTSKIRRYDERYPGPPGSVPATAREILPNLRSASGQHFESNEAQAEADNQELFSFFFFGVR